MNPRIIALSGSLKGTEFPVTEVGFVLGRKHPENDASLEDDDMVSRRHCRFELRDGRAVLLDLESRNGTFVNGAAVIQRVLEHGDRVKVGSSTFIYMEQAETADGLPAFEDDDRERTRTILRIPVDRCERSDTVILRAIVGITSSINAIRSSEQLQAKLLELILEVLPAHRAGILLTGHKEGEFVSGTYLPARFPVSPEITNQVLAEGVAAMSNDLTPILCVPLTVFETKLGVIYIEGGKFDREHVELLTAIAGISAVALEHARYVEWLEGENDRLSQEADVEHGMVGDSPKMQPVYQIIRRVAPSDATVLILGESGTGKELVAQAIHRSSARARSPFVAVNCAAIADTLRESELFGHEKGAFTGAVAQRAGKIELADGGTLFLDEVGELSLPIQAALLRVLQEQEFERVGGTRAIHVDVRIVAATNRDLKAAIKDGRFREDLYFRLNVVGIRMPSLSERREDIPLLAAHFLQRFARHRAVSGFTPEARRLMIAYDWPGNVRELKNAVERAVVIGASKFVLPEDLPESLTESSRAEAGQSRTFFDEINEFKRSLIKDALKAGGSRPEAARILQISQSYFNRLIHSLDIRH